ncbi:MAG: hypothetical protein IPJ77_23680 [Planctomycetes bacterium]|nr:hypothetical protein [Planctomycetota bacterium]
MSTRFPLVLFPVLLIATACAEFRAERRTRPDDDPSVRAGAVGSGTLVCRSKLPSSRVGLVSLEDGAWHVLELEQSAESHPHSFAGPDTHGRYVYFTLSRELVRTPPTLGESLLLGPDAQRRYDETWRSKRDRPKDPLERKVFAPTPVRLVVGDIDHPNERVLDERDPADQLEKLVALSPTQGKVAWLVFDFDATGLPQGLHLELRDLDDESKRSWPLGRPFVEVAEERGPGLAWLGDERHLIFLRDAARVDHGEPFSLVGDWDGGPKSAPAEKGSDSRGPAYPTVEPKDLVLCALDTETGVVRDLGRCDFAWPIDGGDGVLASDGRSTWIVHAADGSISDMRPIPETSPLRSPKDAEGAESLSWIGVVDVLAQDRVFTLDRAAKDAALPRNWRAAMKVPPTSFGLVTTTRDGREGQRVLPLVPCAYLDVVGASLPRDYPWLRRAAKHDDD